MTKEKQPKNPRELVCPCGVTVKVGRYKGEASIYKCGNCQKVKKNEK